MYSFNSLDFFGSFWPSSICTQLSYVTSVSQTFLKILWLASDISHSLIRFLEFFSVNDILKITGSTRINFKSNYKHYMLEIIVYIILWYHMYHANQLSCWGFPIISMQFKMLTHPELSNFGKHFWTSLSIYELSHLMTSKRLEKMKVRSLSYHTL